MITFRIQEKACIKNGKTCTYQSESMVNPHAEADGFNYPKPYSKVNPVYKIRMDGKRHLDACCALPYIGPFQDWKRAVSWALRLDWQDPDKK